MIARNIKVGSQYLARLDSSTERTQVMVIAKHRVQKTTTELVAGSYPSLHVSIRTVFDVRNSVGAWTLTCGVEARDLFELPAPDYVHHTRESDNCRCLGCYCEDCVPHHEL